MKQDITSRQRTSRKRIIVSLCMAGLVTGALGAGMLGADAQESTIPGESVPAAPTQVAPNGAQAGDHEHTDTTATTTTPAPAPQDPPSEQQQQPQQKQGQNPSGPGPAPADPAPADPPATPPATPDPPAPAAPAPPAPAAPAPAPAATDEPAAVSCDDGGKRTKGGRGCAQKPTRTESRPKRKAVRRHVEPVRRDAPVRRGLRSPNGVPTLANPTTSLALPGPAPIGVPNFFIDKFRIPPFLLPIYQAAGIQYGMRWEILAAINEIETDYGRNLNVSSAGALGWMQFMPATWRAYGVDANRDGQKDPYSPVDAIFAAARYLKAAGGQSDLRRAIFAYNHADWYVDSVLMRARVIGGLPSDLVGSLTGLTQGHFPVFARARYADDLGERAVRRRVAVGANAAQPVESTTRRGINIFAAAGSPAIAVQDGKIVAMGRTRRLGRYVKLRDVYGNTYTYAHLKRTAALVPVPREKSQSRASVARELDLPTVGKAGRPAGAPGRTSRAAATIPPAALGLTTRSADVRKDRLFAHPERPRVLDVGGREQILDDFGIPLPGYATLQSYFSELYGLGRDDVVLKPLVPGRRVIAGTILGRIGTTSTTVAPHMLFEVRPAGRGAPRIDPKPILDGWKLLESTAIYRVRGKNPLSGGGDAPSIGQILLMSKEDLQQRVLHNPRIEVYSCGQRDIRAGLIDRRVLATLEFLAASGLKPTITSLRCGHGYLTASGNVSHHSSGNAVDIAKINGIPILGHQGAGSITDIAVRRLLTLQGTLKPAQIITLMRYDGTDNTLAMGDHADHIHLGWQPQPNPNSKSGRLIEAVLKPTQWIKLIDRLAHIDNPTVRLRPSKYAIRAPARRPSRAHRGE